MEKVEFNNTSIIVFSSILISIFLIFIPVFISTTKIYQYYIEAGSIKFENKDKIIKFNFLKITQVYSSNSLFYKGVVINQTKPYQKVSFLLNKDNEFISFIKNQIDIYKNSISNVEINVKYMENNFMFIYLIFLLFFQVVGMINTVFLDYINNGINLIISLICLIGLIIILIKMIKSIRKSKR